MTPSAAPMPSSPNVMSDNASWGNLSSGAVIHCAVILGTRPEAIKLAPVICALRDDDHFKVTVILTGQHREMVDQVMGLFNLHADRDLAIMQPKQTLTQITCGALTGLEDLLVELAPDVVLVQGDTTTAFAAALAAFYQKIPVGHVEAGLRTHDLWNPYPEEANRRLISQVAQFHFAPTPAAVANLEKSGITAGVYHTGNTVIDALLQVRQLQLAGQFAAQPSDPQSQQISPSPMVSGLNWQNHRVILATVHRRENWGAPLTAIAQAWLEILTKFPDVAVVLPMHKNPVVREPLQGILGDHPRVFLCEPFSYSELVAAMAECYLVMTDSGGLQEEAPALGKPVLVLRLTTERPEAITAGTAQLVGTDTEAIVAAAQTLLTDSEAYSAMANVANPFGDGRASQRIVQILRGQTPEPLP
jgi:UDP-N-acetylglucosamine 2-epimerase (non-hydrolysing)